MATLENFNEELPALGTAPAVGDATFVYNASSGRIKQVTVTQSRAVTAEVTTASTLVSVAPEGLTVIQATSSCIVFVPPPTIAGQKKSVVFAPIASVGSTGTISLFVNTATTLLPTLDGVYTGLQYASSILRRSAFVELTSLTTSLWAITSANAITTSAVGSTSAFTTSWTGTTSS